VEKPQVMAMASDEELLRIATDVGACAASWEPTARLIGNVSAGELWQLAGRFVELVNRHAGCADLLARHDALRAELAAERDEVALKQACIEGAEQRGRRLERSDILAYARGPAAESRLHALLIDVERGLHTKP